MSPKVLMRLCKTKTKQNKQKTMCTGPMVAPCVLSVSVTGSGKRAFLTVERELIVQVLKAQAETQLNKSMKF